MLAQSLQKFWDPGADFEAEIDGVGMRATTHGSERFRKASFEALADNPAEGGSSAQDSDISVAVYRNFADVPSATVNVAEGGLKGAVMHKVPAVEQSAVDIEDVGVESEPRGIAKNTSRV